MPSSPFALSAYWDRLLVDILNAAETILRFKGEIDKTSFTQDTLVQSAILYQLLIIGEAVRRLSTEFIDTTSDIPWRMISGTRNRLIHRYDDIDLDIVWKVLETDIPSLISRIKAMLTSPDE